MLISELKSLLAKGEGIAAKYEKIEKRTCIEQISTDMWIWEINSFLRDCNYFLEKTNQYEREVNAFVEESEQQEEIELYHCFRRATAMFFLAVWDKISQLVNKVTGEASSISSVDSTWLIRHLAILRIKDKALIDICELCTKQKWWDFCIKYRNRIDHRHDPETNGLILKKPDGHVWIQFDKESLPFENPYNQAFDDTLAAWKQILDILESRV